ncbi:HNH endonuclease [Pontibacillus sp. HMF3514]|nr:HNH endonuclease [Pontibacillus sp. HMF3514]
MPKNRLDSELWRDVRKKIWNRDGGKCTKCLESVDLNSCHIDHKKSGLMGTNKMKNLRTLCRRCHVLRADIRHQGMIDRALQDGIINPGWRDNVWDD